MARGIQRRAVLGGLGGLALVAAGGLVWRADERGLLPDYGSGPAFEARRDWESRRYRGPLALVAAGVLAASPHNTQPWAFHVAPGRIDLRAVPGRHLGAFDPYRREMTIGLGCAIENMAIAAGREGLAVEIALMPRPDDPTLAATLSLSPTAIAQSPLSEAIGRRRTDRNLYAVRPVAEADLAALERLSDDPAVRLVLWPAASDAGRAFGAATVEATEAIAADPEMMGWSKKWTRYGRADIERRRDGVTISCAGLPPLLEIASAVIPEPSARAEGGYWLNLTRSSHVPSAAAFGMILVRDPYDAIQGLKAGRLWQRLHLEGTRRGLSMQPLNQVPERIDRERETARPPAVLGRAARFIGQDGWRPTFGFRLGYPTRTPGVSPRRPVAAVLV